MRVIVCGGRDFADVPWMWAVLDAMDAETRISCVIDGAQQQEDEKGRIIGADYWANQWALARNKPIGRFYADWKKYGRSAGPRRNRRMGEESAADVCVPFPRANGEWGNGTRGMVEIARELGIKIHFPTVEAV